MAEFVEVMKNARRMCLTYRDCNESCPFYAEMEEMCTAICNKEEEDVIIKAEEIIMAWAKEHPVETMLSKFIEVFGKENVKYTVEYDGFWESEYEAPTEGVNK